MSLIKRITKGIPLTHQELDNNLQYLDDKINNLPTPPTIDETTLVHKSGDEEIGGAKLLTGDFKVATSDPADSTKSANIVSRSKVTTPISYLEASMTYAGVNEYSYLNVKPKGAYMGSNTGYIGTYNKVAQIIDNEVDLISDKIVIQGKAGNINKYEGFLKVVNDGAGKYVLQSVSSIGGVVTKTYAEIQAMITAKTLVVGTDYKITGVDTTLYGGTDIILKANTTNELAEKGVGFFYNPRYTRNSKGIGQGMWNDKVIVYLGNANNSPTGTFLDGDLVTANNGATGNLVLGIVRWGYNYITPVSGDWSTSTSFTNGTGASSQTYPSSDVIIPGYAVNATTIWGGKLWKNLTGAIGTVLNEYALDATNWVAVAYNETDYDLVIDDIWYSIATDKIIGRYEVIGNNKVIFQANYESAANTNSPIKQFQWGNPYSRTYFNGLANNEIVNSILSCINDKGSTIRNNKLNTAKINTNTFFNNSKIEGNILTAGAYIQACTLNSSSMSNNQILNGCNWSNLKFSGGSMDNNFMIGGYVSGYYQPVLSGTSVNGNFFNNYLFSPGINGVPLIPSTGFTNHVKSVRGTDIDDLASRGDVNILSRIAVNDANYVLTQTDDLISFTTLTQTRSVSLPAPGFWALPYFPNRTFTIKDESGTATTNPITIVGTIDGVVNPTIINSNFGKYEFYFTGTSWFSK